ncbi:MAG: DUF6249 domain-containing protein [Chitinophagaceae bacterium]
MPAAVALFLITMFTGFFACVFGIYYLNTRQNLAMIEKGMNPKIRYNRPAPFRNLKWALLLIGAGSGLFAAYLIDILALQRTMTYVVDGHVRHYYNNDNPAIYFALIAIGGGIGLFGSYKIEKKWWDENKELAQA